MLPPLRPGPDLTDTSGMALLERELPLTSLADYADEARRGDGRVVLVSGEAGVGKSALLAEFAAGLSDALWCWGACDGLFTPRPLGALLDLSGQLGGDLARLCRVQGPRDDLFTAVLDELSAQRGLCVVVIEDIHWADEATLDLLRFLARRIRGLPVLIVATYREDELAVSYPLRVALGGARGAAVYPADRTLPAVAGDRGGHGRGQRPGRRRAVPGHRRKPVLRRGGAADRAGPGTALGPRRGAGPGRATRAGGVRRARCRGTDRFHGRAVAA